MSRILTPGLLQQAKNNIPTNGYTSAYQSILDYANAQQYSLPSSNQQDLQNDLIDSLISNSLWHKLHTFFVMATDGDSDFACIDWKNPNTNGHHLLKINSPTFTSDLGFVASPTARLQMTGFNPSTYSGWGVSNTEASFGFFGKASTEGNPTIGFIAFGNPSFGIRFLHDASSGATRFGIGESTTAINSDDIPMPIGENFANTDADTFRMIARTGTTQTVYIGDYDGDQVMSGNVRNGVIDLMPSGNTGEEYRIAWVADYLNPTETAALKSIINSYISTL